MADVPAEVGDPDSQEVIMDPLLIATVELQRMQIAILQRQLAENEEKLKLQQKQSSERASPEVNVKKVSKKQPLEHQESHRASKKIKMELLLPEHGGGPSPIYYHKQNGRIGGSRETKLPQDRFDHRSQDHRGLHERYRDLPPAERGQPDERSPERPHWERRQQDENFSSRPPQAHWRDETRESCSDSQGGSPRDWDSSDAEDRSEMKIPPAMEYQDDNLPKKEWREYSGCDRNFNKYDWDRQGRQRDRFHHRSHDRREPHEKYRDLPLAEREQPDDRLPWERRQQDKNVFGRPPHNRRRHHRAHLRDQSAGSNQPQFSPPLKRQILQLDCIDFDTYHLERTELLSKVTTILKHHQFLLFSSPAASGKTSLLKIMEHVLGIPCIYLSCRSPSFSTSKLEFGEGNDVYNKPFKLRKIKYECIVMLDDAQAVYHNISFWEHLIKVGPWIFPSNIHFVIAATHMLTDGLNPSPIVFQSLQRLNRDDFLLSEQEAKQFISSPEIGLPDVMLKPNLIALIIRECAGLVGALRLSVDTLKTRFAEDPLPSEPDLLSYYLSSECIQLMGRCFNPQHSSPIKDNFRFFLIRCFLDNPMESPDLLDEKDKQCFDWLQKVGLLVERKNHTFEFSSPLARRYYSQWLFPHRSLHVPVSLVDLVKKVIENMSAFVLQQSTVDADDFPKEATFQHLWMQGLAQFTPATCLICPELSKVFPFAATSSTSKIAGEINFYLNGDLHWGIELLVIGNEITEHIDRFGEQGKYFPVSVNDYAIVDFRGNKCGQPTNIDSHPKRITVFFKCGDFSKCQCLFGLDKEPVTLTLKP